MNEQHVVFVSETRWQVAAVREGEARLKPVDEPRAEEAASSDHAPYAEAARQKLIELGHDEAPVLLALPSPWCPCAVISTADLERGQRRQAMHYRLEEHLPISAEDAIADYIELPNDQALGVCAEYDRLAALIEALHAAGVHVRHVCPTALLAAGDVVAERPDVDAVLMNQGDAARLPSYDLLMFKKGKPTQWWWLAEDTSALQARLDSLRGDAHKPWELIALPAAGPEAAADESTQHSSDGSMTNPLAGATEGATGSLTVTPWASRTPFEAAARHAGRILQDAASPWIDLRREALAPPGQYQACRAPAGALLIAAILLLVGVIGMTQWRAMQYQSLATQKRAKLTELTHVLPNQDVDTQILRSRLRSEAKKLAGLSGSAANDEGPRQTVSALTHLRRVLERLNSDVRFRLIDLSIQPKVIRIEGQARSYAKAEQLAGRLRRTGDYEVSQPETRGLEQSDGVSFWFNASPRQRPSQGAAR